MEQFFLTFVGTITTTFQVLWAVFLNILPNTIGEGILTIVVVLVFLLIILAVVTDPEDINADNKD